VTVNVSVGTCNTGGISNNNNTSSCQQQSCADGHWNTQLCCCTLNDKSCL
jgi:hypothetical protein